MQIDRRSLLVAVLAIATCGCNNGTASIDFVDTLPGKVDETGFVHSLTEAEKEQLLQMIGNAEKIPLGTPDSEGILTASEKSLPDIRHYSPVILSREGAAFVRFQQEEPFAIDGLLVLTRQDDSWYVRREYIFGIE